MYIKRCNTCEGKEVKNAYFKLFRSSLDWVPSSVPAGCFSKVCYIAQILKVQIMNKEAENGPLFFDFFLQQNHACWISLPVLKCMIFQKTCLLAVDSGKSPKICHENWSFFHCVTIATDIYNKYKIMSLLSLIWKSLLSI